MKICKAIPYVIFIFILAMVSRAFAEPILSPFDLGSTQPYCIIQLGDPPEFKNLGDDDQLDITSNSSVFGSVLKGLDTKPVPDFKTKLSTSKVVDGSWDVETGVVRDKTSSAVFAAGSTQNDISAAQMEDQIRGEVFTAAAFWSAQAATNLTAAQHSALDGGGGLTLSGSTGGANVFNSTDNFIVNGETLTLTGGVGDFFVFNIFPDQDYQINDARIELLGDLHPGEVLFNVLGEVGGGAFDDAHITESLFMGTLLSTKRNTIVEQSHFNTFVSSLHPDDDGGFEAPSTTLVDWRDAADGSGLGINTGLFGQVIAGGKIEWSESDIACPCPVPEPSTIALLGIGLVGLIGGAARKKWKKKEVDKG